MKDTILSIAQEALATEVTAIQSLSKFIDSAFAETVEAIHLSKGRLVVTGIGKSAIIAQKIVATCNSTGTHSVYLHAADAIHGDSGIIEKEDIILIISKSGESPEIKALVSLLHSFGNTLIGMVGNTESYLAKSSNYILNTTVEKEACINNLAPTSSTTAQMVMGDLVAIALMELNKFSAVDFAKFHPGGNLGKRLTLTTGQIAKNNEKPAVKINTSLKDIITTISKNRLGATAVLDDHDKVIGIITDGDIRRMLAQHNTIEGIIAKDIFHSNPIFIDANLLAAEAAIIMQQKDISQLIVADANEYIGIVHIHDLMREGII